MSEARRSAMFRNAPQRLIGSARNGGGRRREERLGRRAADVAAMEIERLLPEAIQAVADSRRAHDELDVIDREIMGRYFERLDTRRACDEALGILRGANPTLLAFLRDRRDYVVRYSGIDDLEERLAAGLRKDAERARRAHDAFSEAYGRPLRLLGAHIARADGPTCQALFHRFIEARSVDGNSAVTPLLERLQNLRLKPGFGGPGGQR